LGISKLLLHSYAVNNNGLKSYSIQIVFVLGGEMKAFIPAVQILMCTATQATAFTRTVTCYLDGAIVEYESGYTNGYMEVSLPGGIIKDSLRIKPEGDNAILRLEMRRIVKDRTTEKDIELLTDRQNLLADKLRLLDSKEHIFVAAAKSQSGRALRRSKSNPDPLSDIRKGTAFAVTQLESVFAQRRKCENSLSALNAKLSALRNSKGEDRKVCTIWFSRKSGKARILYITADRNWKPVYDFRLDGKGHVRMVMKAMYDSVEKNTALFVISGSISDAGNDSRVRIPVSRQYDEVGGYLFAVDKQIMSQDPVNSIFFSFINRSGQKFPPGTASCFLKGEYIGEIAFKGAAIGETVNLSAGSISGR
jgi:hypothetical protein